MLRIDITNSIIGVGVGGADEVTEYLDEKAVEDDPTSTRQESFKGARDWGRVAMVGLGFLGQALNVMPKEATALWQSSLPLVTKSAIRAVRKARVTEQVSTRTYSEPRVPASPGAPRSRVTWRPKIVEAQ